MRAERRLGEMLILQKQQGGLNPAATLKKGSVLVADEDGKKAPTLADAGISYDLSSRAQKIAAVPEAEYEAEVGEWRSPKLAGATTSWSISLPSSSHLHR